jgi:hypothetical protein
LIRGLQNNLVSYLSIDTTKQDEEAAAPAADAEAAAAPADTEAAAAPAADADADAAPAAGVGLDSMVPDSMKGFTPHLDKIHFPQK